VRNHVWQQFGHAGGKQTDGGFALSPYIFVDIKKVAPSRETPGAQLFGYKVGRILPKSYFAV
ncbi:hypothetical protein, partial [Paraprevotella clara]